MRTKLSTAIILSVIIFSSAYGEKIIAQPESREIFLNNGTYVQYETTTGDPNFVHIGFNTTDYNDGSLVLAFKLPEIPAGQRITSATFHWFYVERYKLYGILHDIYVLPYRPASASPVIVSEDGHFIGAHDTANAMLLKHNVCDAWNASSNQTINQWRDTSASSDALALFLQNQCYNAGAQAGDWFFIRFNQQSDANSYVRETIRGPLYADPNYRPYIEYTLGPAAERIVAQPETREVFFDTQIFESSYGDWINHIFDVNYSNMTFNDAVSYFSGDLVLAFKLPQLPPNKVIAKASLKWYYVSYYKTKAAPMDLYGLHYKPAATSPVITYDPDYYNAYPSGTDTRNGVVLIQQNIAPVALFDPGQTTGSINQWVSSDIDGHWLALWLQNQYAEADAEDWALLRFTTTEDPFTVGFRRHTMYSPRHIDPNYRPYIEYELADTSEGSWRPITVEAPVTITDTGVVTGLDGYLGCFEIGGIYKNVETLVPFQYPQLSSGEYVRDVDLSVSWLGYSGNSSFDVDLYGLPHRSSTSFVSTDYWVGPYAPLPGDVPDMNSGTPLQSHVFRGYSKNGGEMWSIDPNGALRTACYMNSLKTAGATSSDYGFLRFGERFEFNYYKRNSMGTKFDMWARVGTQTPTCLPAPDTEGACLTYLNPGRLNTDLNYDCAITFKDFAVMAERWMQCAAVPVSYCN